ncbi:MAG: polyprenyl synthetase family protein [Desulfotignum sp.]
MNDHSCNLPAFLQEHQALVNTRLEKILGQFDFNRELVQAMTHSLMAGGKRLRPVLAMASARACGGDVLLALPAACALEMIHTYSLIHDDLPAMDDDDLRRGLPTCHKKFGEATAVLAGDALLTHAFYILSCPHALFEPVPEPENLLELIAIISEAAGVNGMVEGQVLDMQSDCKNTKQGNKAGLLDHLTHIHALKTGRMICASVASGAVSVDAPDDFKQHLAEYAVNVGLAFQVMDDILNVQGDPKKMGKAAGSDAVKNKLTFPAIMGVKGSIAYAKKLTDGALEALEIFNGNADPLRAIAGYVINRDR